MVQEMSFLFQISTICRKDPTHITEVCVLGNEGTKKKREILNEGPQWVFFYDTILHLARNWKCPWKIQRAWVSGILQKAEWTVTWQSIHSLFLTGMPWLNK